MVSESYFRCNRYELKSFDCDWCLVPGPNLCYIISVFLKEIATELIE